MDALRRNVETHPHWPVYRYLDASGNVADLITCYGAFHTAQSVARHLTGACGLKPGDRVVLVYPPGKALCLWQLIWNLFMVFLQVPKWVVYPPGKAFCGCSLEPLHGCFASAKVHAPLLRALGCILLQACMCSVALLTDRRTADVRDLILSQRCACAALARMACARMFCVAAHALTAVRPACYSAPARCAVLEGFSCGVNRLL